ncbi:hypothetical protein M378DRAFT_12035 [Amanita muscaria Koide BX008]|uniref:Uncharacterized protein n=1 Tax=Amanita muscaria (strain Koide BX008) TaxID=946122 RepID=A0A0C2X334_AMAMK|nr:hypothetical protein M378DRAFT_12035 [Amanita muscaria Koide BX008]
MVGLSTLSSNVSFSGPFLVRWYITRSRITCLKTRHVNTFTSDTAIPLALGELKLKMLNPGLNTSLLIFFPKTSFRPPRCWLRVTATYKSLESANQLTRNAHAHTAPHPNNHLLASTQVERQCTYALQDIIGQFII